jgi:hypothetical protein
VIVTNLFQQYRIAARSNWNLFFRSDPDLVNWDLRDHFERIKKLLFEALVLQRLSLDAGKARFRVVPSVKDGVPIKIEQPREGDRNHYWDHPIQRLRPSEAALEFLDYFDWDALGSLDFKYIRVRIREFPTQPHLVGREALLEPEYAEIFVDGTTECVAELGES